MKAIFVVGGQQYFVQLGDEIYVQKLNYEVGSVVTFDQVLMVNNQVGKPTVTNATVACEVVKHGKQPKIRVVKFISQKRHMKTHGHVQKYTKLCVKAIKN